MQAHHLKRKRSKDGEKKEVQEERERNRAAVINAVEKNGLALEQYPSLNNDSEVVMAAVKQNGLSLQYASPSLRDNEEVVS